VIQLQFLNKVLQSHDASLLVTNNLTQEYFSDYQEEFNFIQQHLRKYGTVPDEVTFLTKFPEFDIIKVEESDSYLIDALFEDRNKRMLARVFNKVRELLNVGKVEEAMNTYMAASSDVVKATHLEAVDILSDTSRYDAYIERTEDYNKYYVKTGIKELDDIIGGWDRKEELALIAARTNVGKSWMLLKVAIAAAEQGLKVGLYSGEMSENKVGYRIDTLISHISNGKLIHGDASIQNDYKRYLENLSTKVSGSIKVLTPKMIGTTPGVTALRAFIEKEKLDMLCIDQHSLLEDDRGARDPVQKAANISKDLKTLQVLKQIPIISVSQLNRTAVNSEIGLDASHIAQSDRIAQDSTVILGLEKKDNVMTISLIKSRDSLVGAKLKYAIDLDKGLFMLIPNEEDATKGKSCEDLKKQFEAVESTGDDVF
jgi:replicative DNA helicase